jgi:hypothetical protein
MKREFICTNCQLSLLLNFRGQATAAGSEDSGCDSKQTAEL